MFGFNVRVFLIADGVTREAMLHNVTEIHGEYRPGKIAFESSIHQTGCTYDNNATGDTGGRLWVREYEALPACEKADAF